MSRIYENRPWCLVTQAVLRPGRMVQSQNPQLASQRPVSAAGSCSPVAFEGESELRKLTPTMHRSSKAESCARWGGQVGSNLGCLVTAFLFPKPVLSGFRLERLEWEGYRKAGSWCLSVSDLSATAEPFWFLPCGVS